MAFIIKLSVIKIIIINKYSKKVFTVSGVIISMFMINIKTVIIIIYNALLLIVLLVYITIIKLNLNNNSF